MKKIVAFILALTILLIPALSVGAYVPYVSAGAVCVTPIQFSDAEGNPIAGIAEGAVLQASCEVKKGENAAAAQKVTLILAVYSGNVLVKLGSAAVELTDEKVQPLTASAEVPAGKNLSAKAYVWDDLTRFRPLTEKAVYGSGKADVKRILIDGEPLAGFDPSISSYDYTVSAAHINYPELIVETADLAAKTEIICNNSFPAEQSSVTVKVTSSDGTAVKEYNIHYTQEKPAVTNAKYNPAGAASVNLATEIMQEPVYAEGKEPALPPSGTYADNAASDRNYSTGNMPESYTHMYSDRLNSHFRDVAPEWLGATAIVTPYSGTFGDTANKQLFTFDINRSATVYVECADPTAFGKLDWVKSEGWQQDNYSSQTNGLMGKRLFPETGGAYYQNLATYSKTFDVEKGQTKTITIPYGVQGRAMSIVVKFIDSAISKAKIGDNSATVLRQLYSAQLVDDTQGYTLANTRYGIKMWTGRGYPLYRIPKELEGAEAIVLPWTWDANYKGKDVSFDLNHSADVYVMFLANPLPAWLNTLGFTQIPADKGFDITYCGGGTTVGSIWKTRQYKKTVYLEPGETIHINLKDGFPENAGCPLVWVKAIDLK